MPDNLADQYDQTNLQVAISLAARMQAGTIRTGDDLQVTLPGTDQTIGLKVLGMGNIDPDILDREDMVDPDTQDRPPLPGMLVDTSALYGGEPNNTIALTFDNNDKIPAASVQALDNYEVNPSISSAYQQRFGGQDVTRINMRITSGGETPEVLPATKDDFISVGMNAAADALPTAQRVQPVPAPTAGNNFQ